MEKCFQIEENVYTDPPQKIKDRGDKMCESTVYSTDNEKIMEDVLSIKINGNNIELIDILGFKKEVKGKIVEIDLDKHGIYIKID